MVSFVKRLLGNIVFIFYVKGIMMSFGMSNSPCRVPFFLCIRPLWFLLLCIHCIYFFNTISIYL